MRPISRIALPLLVFLPALVVAEEVPLSNWTVPPYRGSLSAQSGLTTMTDVTPGVGFVGVAPCRLVDTRQAGFPAGYGTPALSAGVPRNFDLNSDPLCTGIPVGVDAYSLNVTVTNTQGPGFILIYPQGGSQPTVSTLNYVANETVANAAIVPAGPTGGITVIAGVSGTNLIIDINGYFTDQYNPSTSFHAVSSSDSTAAIIGDNSSTLGLAFGVLGRITTATTGSGSAGVRGINSGTGPSGVGVWGSQAGSGWGVYGEAPDGVGVYGKATATVGANYGMRADTASQATNSAGIRASNGGGPLPLSILTSGARGEAGVGGIGVLGLSKGFAGASGYHVNSAGTDIEAGADLGYTSTVGLNVTGTTQATGMKNFIEPHPTDPSRVIRYASLEGNEVGTYFRGRGKFQNGIATIPVPEDFRIVTAPEGLGIQVTPIGEMATVAVQTIGLDRIVVRGSRNVEFFYTVNGIRLAYKDAGPIAANDKVFVPRSPDALMPEAYPPVIRERLISNGTYRPDGTVNTETARRLGWDREWEKRTRPAPQPAVE
jgi:hypothetical protein